MALQRIIVVLCKSRDTNVSCDLTIQIVNHDLALVDRLLQSSNNLIILHLTLNARLETGSGHLLGALSIRWLNGAACHIRLIVYLEVERVAFVSEMEVRKSYAPSTVNLYIVEMDI